MVPSKRTILLLAALAGLAALPARAAAASSPAHASSFTFRGSTDQCPAQLGGCGKVVIRVSRRLERVSFFSIQYVLDCQSGRTLAADSAFTSVTTVTRGGLKFEGTSAPFTITLQDGFTGNATADLHGTLHRNTSGRGAFAEDVTVLDGQGQPADRCTTGDKPIAWRVKLRRR